MVLLLIFVAPKPDVLGSPTRDGWGFGIADDAGPERAILSGSGFRRLETKVFRFQVPYNAGYFLAEMDRAAKKIAEARAAGVQSIMVTFGAGAGQSNPPGPADWQTAVRWFLDRFDGDVDIWGVANEPNTSWLAGAHSGNPCLLAGYYAALHAELASRGGVDLLVSPEWRDEVKPNGDPKLVKDLPPSHPDYHAGDTRSTVQHYIDHYTSCGGSFGGAVGWHPYGGVSTSSAASTLDLLAHTPSYLPVFFTEVGSLRRTNNTCSYLPKTDAEQEEEVRWLVEKLANEHPRIQRVYYYQERPPPPDACTWDSGLEDSSGGLRSAWWKYCSATHNGPCDSCTGLHCDDGSSCTDDTCSAGQCVHAFAPRCLAPILSLLVDDDVCGDGVVDTGEPCDDGNTSSGDGCSTSCQVENCFSCGGSPSTCSPIATCADGDGCCLATCAGQDLDCVASTSSTPIAGTKLRLSDAADPRLRQINLVAKDLSINGAGINPIVDGAHLQIYNPATGESGCVSLPSTTGAWRASGTGANVSYRYKDSYYANGPCKVARIRKGNLTATCRAAVQPIPYTLDESQQGSVGVNFKSGQRTFCALFGGVITSDVGTSVSNRGVFAAGNAPPPAMCPAVPVPCP